MGICVIAAAAMFAAGAVAGPLTFEEPAPGREDGRVYYYVPGGVDLSRPAPLLVFLHGGSASTPDTAPGDYLGEGRRWLMPDIANAPFIVAAPSAPPAPDGSRWNRDGVSRLVDATIAAACGKFKIDPDRIFLGGHSMGCYGAYHLGQILADRFAGVWCSSGAWWEADFRAFLGTPVYIQHGALDCSPRPGYSGEHDRPRRHDWCGVSFARAADELMTRYGVEHVYDEHGGGHSLAFPEAKAAMRRFFEWAEKRRRDPYARRTALVTPCGTMHPDVERVSRSRWLEIVETADGGIDVDAVELRGPNVAESDEDLGRQTYVLAKRRWSRAARIVAENLGGNRFRVEAENVKSFRIYLAPRMGDLSRPFAVEFQDGRRTTVVPSPVKRSRDYTAVLAVRRDGLDVDFVKELVSIPSESRSIPECNRATAFLKGYLERRGVHCHVERTEEGRDALYAATLPGKEHDFAFVTHIDVVPAADRSQFVPKVVGDEIWGRGACDTKVNAALIAQVLANLAGKASVGAFFATDEDGCAGKVPTCTMLRRAGFVPRRMILVGDTLGDSTNRLFVAQKGHWGFRLTAKGRGGHSSIPWKLDNAIPKITKAVDSLMAAYPKPPEGSDWHSTLAPTVLRAGDAPNSVPGEASATFSFRYVGKDDVAKLTKLVRETTGMEPETLYCVPPVQNDPDSPLVKGLFAAMQSNWPDRDFRIANLYGATDAFQFADLNLPTVIFTHDGAGAHKPDEHGSLASAAEYLDFFTRWISNQ